MPPVSQGNRAALVTWSVITGILFVLASIFAIYFYVDANKSAQKLEDTTKRYNDIVAPGELASQQITDLKSLRTAENPPPGITPNTPVFQVLLTQRDSLAKLVGGPTATDTGANTAFTSAKGALDKAGAAAKEAGITVPTSDNLALAVSNLADGVRSLTQKNKDLTNQFADAKKQVENQVKAFDAARAEMDKQIAAARDEQQKTATALASYTDKKNADVSDIEKNHATQIAAMQESANKAQVAIADKQRQIDKLTADIEVLRTRLGDQRINTQNVVTRQPDGKILRIPGKDTVYINLGSADSITPGLTFEVYDKFEGIPPAGDPSTDENLPKGKASIEVTRVGSNSSEAHITRQTPGTQITEGDLIANLIYDPNTKYNFMVYGDFDLDHNNVATPQEADVVRRLVTQWGGKLTDKVDVDTDFVVLGKEPVIPNFSKEDLQDPFNAKKLADAQQAADQYAAVKKAAIDLHIPIVNQNRFLYLIGYYAQAKR